MSTVLWNALSSCKLLSFFDYLTTTTTMMMTMTRRPPTYDLFLLFVAMSVLFFGLLLLVSSVTAVGGFGLDSFLSETKKHISAMLLEYNSNRRNSNNSWSSKTSDLSTSLSSILPWWDDLAPPFALVDATTDNTNDNDNDDDGNLIDDDDENNVKEEDELDTILSDAAADDSTRRTLGAAASTTTTTRGSRKSSPSPLQPPPRTVTHFCFLVHGHRGMARDLGYLQEVMRLLAKRQKQKLQRRYNQKSSSTTTKSSSSSSTTTSATTASSATNSPSSSDDEQSNVSLSSSTSHSTPTEAAAPTAARIQHDLIIHSAVCNEGKTTDGVANGGDRIVEEMLSVIRNHMEQQREGQNPPSTTEPDDNGDDNYEDITLSVVGNSLGGIYSRYAVAKFLQKCTTAIIKPTSSGAGVERQYILDGRYRVHLNIFCTTASPHLGVSGHTYLPLPRTAELGVAHAMGMTGKDLFRVNDLMKRMATTSEFLTPLSLFRKRIAYANAYGTDFPVPAATAAFLSASSTVPHYFDLPTTTATTEKQRSAVWGEDGTTTTNNNNEDSIDDDDDDDEEGGSDGMIIATLHTLPQRIPSLDLDGAEETTTSTSSSGTGARTEDAVDQPDKEDNAIVNQSSSSTATSPSSQDDLLIMSNCLDSLGWKKVFVDIRREIPIAVPLPTTLLVKFKTETTTSSTNNAAAAVAAATTTMSAGLDADICNDIEELEPLLPSSSTTTNAEESTQQKQLQQQQSPPSILDNNRSVSSSSSSASSSSSTAPATLQELRQRHASLESRDVAMAVGSANDNTWNLPIGHNMLVAFSRSRISTLINKGGRPVVDGLAKELVQDIFSWNGIINEK